MCCVTERASKNDKKLFVHVLAETVSGAHSPRQKNRGSRARRPAKLWPIVSTLFEVVPQAMPKGSSSSSSGKQLTDACEKGDLATVRKLLDKGVDVNWKDELGFTPLSWASGYGHVQIVKLLLDRGAQINMQDNNGWTALMDASDYGRVDCARLLLERGADMFIQNQDGQTAKYYAKEWAKGNGIDDIVRLLDEVCITMYS